jgi:hypothetical protein
LLSSGRSSLLLTGHSPLQYSGTACPAFVIREYTMRFGRHVHYGLFDWFLGTSPRRHSPTRTLSPPVEQTTTAGAGRCPFSPTTLGCSLWSNLIRLLGRRRTNCLVHVVAHVGARSCIDLVEALHNPHYQSYAASYRVTVTVTLSHFSCFHPRTSSGPDFIRHILHGSMVFLPCPAMQIRSDADVVEECPAAPTRRRARLRLRL